jgi:hypothetical protein
MRPLRAPHRATPSQCRSSAARRRQPNAKEVVKRHRRTINCHQLHLSPDTLVATVVWPAQLAKLAAMAAAGRRCYMAATTATSTTRADAGVCAPPISGAAPSGGWLTKRARTQRTSLVDIEPGDHICCFYSGLAERDRILLPYLRAVVHDGGKCLCLIDATDPEAMRAKRSCSLRLPPRPTCTRRFSGDYMVDYLDKTVRTALVSDRFPFVRAVGEMSWVLKEPPGADEPFTYEGALNEFAPRYARRCCECTTGGDSAVGCCSRLSRCTRRYSSTTAS